MLFILYNFSLSSRLWVSTPGSQQLLDIILVHLCPNLSDTLLVDLLDTGNKSTWLCHTDRFIRLMVDDWHNVHRPATNIHHQHLIVKLLHPVCHRCITLRINRNTLHHNMVLYLIVPECDFPVPHQIPDKAVLFFSKESAIGNFFPMRRI